MAGWPGCGAALSFAFYIVYSQRGLARYAPETVLFYTFVVAAFFWACVTPPTRILAAHYDARVWGLFVVLGVCSTLVPFACLYAGLRRLPATHVGVLTMLDPVIAVISSALLLGEGLRWTQWLGAALVLGAGALASVDAPASMEARPERG